MKIIDPSHTFITPIDAPHAQKFLELIEDAARTCYKSEGKKVPGKAGEFVRRITQVKKHESVMEHAVVTIRFICDRGVSHEIVRHRLAAYSQESTRYCNYCDEKFGKELTVIRPFFWDEQPVRYRVWERACRNAEDHYLALLDLGATPQEARSVLPNSLKTEVVMTANMREWRHVLNLRCATNAHPQMRQLMIPVLGDFRTCLPELFDDIHPELF